MKRRKTVQVPSDDASVVKRVTEVFAAVLGRGDDGDPGLPAGWVQLGVDGDGRPLYGWVGPSRNPRLEALAEALRRKL
jgi:hypothetical protein